MKDFFSSNDPDKDGFITRAEWDAMIGYLKRGKNRLIAVKPGGRGDITATHVAWEKTKGLPYVATPLLYRGTLFMVKDGGLASSYDAASGAAHYEQQRLGMTGSFYASPVAGERPHLPCEPRRQSRHPRRRPQARSPLARGFPRRIAATPAIVDDVLYVRTETKLFAFKDERPSR